MSLCVLSPTDVAVGLWAALLVLRRAAVPLYARLQACDRRIRRQTPLPCGGGTHAEEWLQGPARTGERHNRAAALWL